MTGWSSLTDIDVVEHKVFKGQRVGDLRNSIVL